MPQTPLLLSIPPETFRQKDSFGFIKPDEFEALGIDPQDIPVGTFAALKHPAQLQSRFGGNAYGFGLVEVSGRLESEDIALLQSTTFEDINDLQRHHRELNEIYKKIGLLIRFSSLGKPYYLIPVHLISDTLIHIKAKVEEISKIIEFHRTKYLTEHHTIALVTHQDDLIIHELAFRFKEHRFVVLDSLERIQKGVRNLDMVILTRDPYEILLMEKFATLPHEGGKSLETSSVYILWNLYKMLKPDGELFIVADHHTPKTQASTYVRFKTEHEEKNFTLFSHIFKTKRKYHLRNHSAQVNVFDFQKYLSGFYVEQEVLEELLEGRELKDLTLRQMNKLRHMNFSLGDRPFTRLQDKVWPRLLSLFFDPIFLKPLVPEAVKNDWDRRFSCPDYDSSYMIIYLGQKKPLNTTSAEITRDVMDSRLAGCPIALLAQYRDSFEYVMRTLRVIADLKWGENKAVPQIYIDRLKQPLESRSRRYKAIHDVNRLVAKVGRLARVRDYLNPARVEGPRTPALDHLEILTFFGFSPSELKEIAFIVQGHTPLGRIVSGKMNEKALKPLSDLARASESGQAVNLLRYVLLMTMAETEAARGSRLTQGELEELFAIYESTVRVVTNRELDWDRLLDEKISSMGGIHNKVVQKLLMLMNHFEFLHQWDDLSHKGAMEKEVLADYDEHAAGRIENVIQLVHTVERFEELHLKSDPVQLPAFYRKLLEMEFHGTAHLFERMDSALVFRLLWITVTMVRGEIINFNPLLARVEQTDTDRHVRKLEEEARLITTEHLHIPLLDRLGDELYLDGTSFIVGTGFKLRVNRDTRSLEIAYLDMDRSIGDLESLTARFEGYPMNQIPVEELTRIEALFSNVESFHQSHLKLRDRKEPAISLPVRQVRWFERVTALRDRLKTNLTRIIFLPENVYTDLDLLYGNAPCLLNFVLPEFTGLGGMDISRPRDMESDITHYIITSTRKLQALIRHERGGFQDDQFLHRLAQREFGPMATGIVGVSEPQIEILESIVTRIRHNPPLFDALIKSSIFQELGRLPELRKKHEGHIHPADTGSAGAYMMMQERFAERYGLDERGMDYLTFLVRHHSLLLHIIRGEISFSALNGILESRDGDLCDAFFLISFIMLSALREDLILEDLADRLFKVRDVCHGIIADETTLDAYLTVRYVTVGTIYHALTHYLKKGLPEGVTATGYLDSDAVRPARVECVRAGKMMVAMERFFTLCGIRYVGFAEIADFILKVPLKYTYVKRNFSSIGFSTFEREVFEGFRIYKTLQGLREEVRHFFLDRLVGDSLRVFGYEELCGYLNYDNRIKLLLIAMRGAELCESGGGPVCLNFLSLSRKVEKRYEPLNDFLGAFSLEELWADIRHIQRFFESSTGVILTKERYPDVVSIDFEDTVEITRKLDYMRTITDMEQLKNYFHYTLRALRKYPFYADDYELELERAFERRLGEIADLRLRHAERKMELINNFEELHTFVEDLRERSLEIGFSKEQMHRLDDLNEVRKDRIKSTKLAEIDSILDTIHDPGDLSDYWDGIKWYLTSNRRFVGKEFEYMIARKFDEVHMRVHTQSPP